MGKILVLGSTGTIGKELVRQLSNYDFILAGRNYVTDDDHIQLDLENLESIQKAICILNSYSIDAVFVNSGIYTSPNMLEMGIEKNLMVNAVGPYILVNGLCKKQQKMKIILTTSVSIKHAQPIIEVKRDSLIYRNTKLIQLYLFEKLKRNYTNHIFAYAHPGITFSQISTDLHGSLVRFWLKHWANRPEKAVRSLLMAFHSELNEDGWYVPGGFLELWGKPKWKYRNFVIKKNKLLLDIERMTEQWD